MNEGHSGARRTATLRSRTHAGPRRREAPVRETTVSRIVSAPVVARERSQSLPDAVRPTTWETMGRPFEWQSCP